jgi:hypothetical protein
VSYEQTLNFINNKYSDTCVVEGFLKLTSDEVVVREENSEASGAISASDGDAPRCSLAIPLLPLAAVLKAPVLIEVENCSAKKLGTYFVTFVLSPLFKRQTWRVAFDNIIRVLALVSLGHWRRQQQRHQRHHIPHRPHCKQNVLTLVRKAT